AAPANAPNPLAPRPPHFAPKARRVIHLFMAGAPSQLDLFDHKPALAQLEGKPLPPSVIRGQRYAFIRPDAGVLGPRFKFAKHGQCGAELSEMLPHLPTIYTGVRLRNQGDPILDVSSPAGVDTRLQRDSLDLIAALNRQRLDTVGDPEIATRIASYEMAFRLQTSAPELMDLSQESKA